MTASTDPADGISCPWCSASAPAGATSCPACGAALAQRESIGDVPIPGVTAVDPGLLAYDAQPMRLHGPSPSQGLASGVVAAAAVGGPAGLAIIGGLAAVAATEYLGAKAGEGGASPRPEDVGRPSEIALLALERLQHEASAPDQPAEDAEAGASDAG